MSAPHADRDGSERRRSMEREHERGLAADVPDDEPGEVERLRSIEFIHQGCQMLREKDNAYLIERAEKAEAALARVEALAEQWEREAWAEVEHCPDGSCGTCTMGNLAGSLRLTLAEPEAPKNPHERQCYRGDSHPAHFFEPDFARYRCPGVPS